MRLAHEAHVMPVIGSSTGTGAPEVVVDT